MIASAKRRKALEGRWSVWLLVDGDRKIEALRSRFKRFRGRCDKIKGWKVEEGKMAAVVWPSAFAWKKQEADKEREAPLVETTWKKEIGLRR